MEIIITLFIFFLMTIIGLMIYMLYNSSNKIQFYENFIIDKREKYYELLNTIREIDSKDLFEKDDDVGAVFSQIKDEIESFKNIID